MGNKVKTAREHKGMTQKDLAERANTTERNLRRIERGQQPAAKTSVLIAEALGKDPRDLFSDPA